ncbi:hypothetical protein D9M68_506600 [compost metagenome]
MVSSASRSPPLAAMRVRSVSSAMSGTSPERITTVPSSGSCGVACCTAWPVPSWGSWRAKPSAAAFTAVALMADSTCSAPWPVTTTTWRAPMRAAVSVTWASKARPAKRCNTLGSLLFMRVPLPAAMMTTSTGPWWFCCGV